MIGGALFKGLIGKAAGTALMNPWVLGGIALAVVSALAGVVLWWNAQLKHAEANGKAKCEAEYAVVIYKNEMERQGERRGAEADQRARGDAQDASDDAMDKIERQAAADNLKMLMEQSHIFIPDVFIQPLRGFQ